MTDVLVTDIGGVVIDRKNGGRAPSFFIGDYRKAPEIPGAINGLAALYGRFGPRMFTLSRVFPEFKQKTREWFIANHFYRRSKIQAQQAYFCDEKTSKVSYYRDLQATHIIDDRVENIRHVLTCIAGGERLHPNLQLYLFCGNGHADDATYGADLPPSVHRAHSWRELVSHILNGKYHSAFPT